MAETLIKLMIKHRLTMIAAVHGHEENWDVQLCRVLFGDRCGVVGEHQILTLHDLDVEESLING